MPFLRIQADWLDRGRVGLRAGQHSAVEDGVVTAPAGERGRLSVGARVHTRLGLVAGLGRLGCA
jgi:hypothetical protein